MPTSNVDLVLNAEQRRRAYVTEAVTALRKGVDTADFAALSQIYGPWSQALERVSRHITVAQEAIDAAAKQYAEVGHCLLRNLQWQENSIEVCPQGSASTQTLIRYPDRTKFDIDAVCQVDISRVDASDPVGFFEAVGDALREFSPTAKKRCWNIAYPGERFYLEFTPSIPLNTVSDQVVKAMAPRFLPAYGYEETALAVVDMPTKRWKTSNPKGFTRWVDETAARSLIRCETLEFASQRRIRAGVEGVPEQEVEITDTLRTAIRLFKRHRDMCVRREIFDGEFKPISVVIVTLLTRCYAGLAAANRSYAHPLLLLVELAELLPHMVALEGEYRVDNPTVDGENFAERWNDDNDSRYRAFRTWCDVLGADLRLILQERGDQAIRAEVDRVFGTTSANAGTNNEIRPLQMPEHRPPPPLPRTAGLA
ncbi:MAG: nucleotidyltransferase [Lamprobacter sp.]|uniref:nucleotidyltransferase domain-containing protein n=1 Tax=Lamprobacter sp. TaxID=3100796 RepID=UPI002B260042|nr:nucleotidyltransferase [Lamprobacter sp.]MEA3641548.1 nucleotidyltransferase [Lamprobacter sp.]